MMVLNHNEASVIVQNAAATAAVNTTGTVLKITFTIIDVAAYVHT